MLINRHIAMTRLDSFLLSLAFVGFCGALAIADEQDHCHVGKTGIDLTGCSETIFDERAYSNEVGKAYRYFHSTNNDICTPGYAAAHRMSESESQSIKRSLLPAGHRMYEYELDHIIPLCLGGINDRSNLQMQPIDEAREKDKLERKACRMVCRGEIGLDEARSWFRRTH